MRISVSEAKGKLTELVRRAEGGDEIVLTRHGRATVTLVPVQVQPNADARRAVIAATRSAAAGKRGPGVSAARSQDFLYGESGLPE